MPDEPVANPWEKLHELLEAGDPSALHAFLDALGPTESARAISRLDPDDQSRVVLLLEPEIAAGLIEDVPDAQAAGIIASLEPEHAAPIVDAMQSSSQADLLGDLPSESAEAILEQMRPEEAESARELLAYAPDSAGGLMVKEYVAYHQNERVRDVLDHLQANRERFARYDVQYLYVLDAHERLSGVLRMRDLLFPERGASLESVMIRTPLRVRAGADARELSRFFDERKLYGVPVVDAQERLLGVVRREAVAEAALERADRQLRGFSGLVGEELRSMPLVARSSRRLSWLSLNIVLNIVAASVIAYYQDTLSAAIALAVFLPMISDMSGCSGNQAVAVSMRELNLGLVRPHELAHVLAKESSLGVLTGICLGLLLGLAALLWKANPWLGLVVGGALALNTVLAVSLGGLLPLLLQKLRLDPALVSSPILTTVTDMCGFFFVLSFATAVLPRIT
jgi:magnesium transporter